MVSTKSFPLVSRRSALGLAVSPLLLSACGGGDSLAPEVPEFALQEEGLAGLIVYRLRQGSECILAATNNGLYKREGSTWRRAGLADNNLLDVSIKSATEWFASVLNSSGTLRQASRLYRTLDAGQSWQEIAHDFGGVGDPEPMQALAWDASTSRLYATGYDVLAASANDGQSWQVLYGEWHGFSHPKATLAIQPTSRDIWFGGQNAIEVLTLAHFNRTTGQTSIFENIMPRPSVVKGIQFQSSGGTGQVFIAGEGGIAVSDNNGDTWRQVFADGFNFYFDVAIDPKNSNRMLSARWLKNYDTPQAIALIYSRDAGKSWKSHVIDKPERFGGCWSLLPIDHGGRTSFLLGLYKGGVVRIDASF